MHVELFDYEGLLEEHHSHNGSDAFEVFLTLMLFQIECSSIVEYAEKIVKANKLDDGKTLGILLFSSRWLKSC